MKPFRFFIALAMSMLATASAQAQAVFVTDFYNNSILRVDSTTGAAVPPAVGAVSFPSAFAYGPDGFLYAASQGTASVAKINPSSGAVVGAITFSGQIQAPGGIAFAPNGDIFVTDFHDQNTPASGSLKRFSVDPSTGAATLITTLATNLNQPSGVLLNGNTVYYTETNTSTGTGGKLSSVPAVGGTPVALATGAAGTGFGGMALAGNTLYYTDLLGGAIDRYDVGANNPLAVLVASGGSLAFQFPGSLYVDSPTSILVANLGNHQFSGVPGDLGNGSLQRYSTTTGLEIGGNIVSNIYGGALINAVPEPGTLLLVGGTAAFGMFFRRRRSALTAA